MPSLTGNAADGVLANDLPDCHYSIDVTPPLHSFPTRRSSDLMAADGSYTYDPTSIPTLETLSLGDHVETFTYSIADGHGDVSSSTLSITVHITIGTVQASTAVT